MEHERPLFGEIGECRAAVVLFGLDKPGILAEISDVIVNGGGGGTISVNRDSGAKMGDYCVLSFLVSGSVSDMKELMGKLEGVAFDNPVLSGCHIQVLPTLDYRESVRTRHRQHIVIKAYIRDRNGIQRDLMQIFDENRLAGLQHFGRIKSYDLGPVYSGDYVLRMFFGHDAGAENLMPEMDLKREIDLMSERLFTQIKRVFGDQIVALKVNDLEFGFE